MIDTSKAVRPCVEELAGQLNLGLKPQAVKPLFHWWDVKDCFKATTTVNGVTITNNDDGTFSLNGTCTRQSTFNLLQAEIPLNIKTLIPRAAYIPSSGTTSWGTCGLFLVLDILNNINPPSNCLLLGITKSTFSTNGEEHQSNTTSIGANFSSSTAMLVYVGSSLAGNHTNDVYDFDSASISSLTLSLPAGVYNTKFSFNGVDIAAYANIDSYDDLVNKTTSEDDRANMYAALNLRAIVDQTRFENAMWKFTNGNFNVEYSTISSPVMAEGKYFTIGSNS